jgi:peptidoglycan hydrolase CwlO-like protein
VVDLQNQVSELQGKIGSLEQTVQNRDEELRRLKDDHSARDIVSSISKLCASLR